MPKVEFLAFRTTVLVIPEPELDLRIAKKEAT